MLITNTYMKKIEDPFLEKKELKVTEKRSYSGGWRTEEATKKQKATETNRNVL